MSNFKEDKGDMNNKASWKLVWESKTPYQNDYVYLILNWKTNETQTLSRKEIIREINQKKKIFVNAQVSSDGKLIAKTISQDSALYTTVTNALREVRDKLKEKMTGVTYKIEDDRLKDRQFNSKLQEDMNPEDEPRFTKVFSIKYENKVDIKIYCYYTVSGKYKVYPEGEVLGQSYPVVHNILLSRIAAGDMYKSSKKAERGAMSGAMQVARWYSGSLEDINYMKKIVYYIAKECLFYSIYLSENI